MTYTPRYRSTTSLFTVSPLRRVAAQCAGLTLVGLLAALCPCAPAEGQEATDAEVEAAGDERATEINVKNADIGAIVRIFSKKTKRNYILDESVKGKVTIYLPSKVNSEEAIRILDSVLSLKGFSSVPIGENLWKIVPAKQAKQSTIPTMTDSGSGRPTAAMVTRLLNLKYVSADDVKQLLGQLISADGLINAYTGTNSLIIIDGEDNIERLAAIVNSLDVPFTDREMTIIPVVNAEAADIATKLNEILGNPSGDNKDGGESAQASMEAIRARLRESTTEILANRTSLATGGTMPTSTGASAPSALSGKTIAARAREPKIIADERTNSIIVVADEETTARIRALISELDSKVDLSGSKFYVYRCQHAKADDLAAVLSGLSGDSGGTRAGGLGTDAISGGLDSPASFGRSSSRTSSSTSSQGRLGTQQRTPGRSRSENRSGGSPQGSFNLGENISITADPATNSLIISASKTDYEKIRALIEKLDIKRRQVLVEAMLLEVGVDQSQSMSTEFTSSTGGADGAVLAKTDFGNLSKLLADPTKLSNFSVAAASSGTIKLPGGIAIPTQSILLNAAKQNSNVNVLSAPNILTTDNEQAEIVVGQNVPFLASTSTSETNLNNTFNQIDRQDVGITLRITPQISSGDSVTLKIFTEVSNVILATLASPLGPTTTVRTSETTVITKDSQMIVIGGLMSDDISEDESGVPFLADVPILGHMFRSVREAHRRTNLLIFITPRIIQDQFDARDVTVDRRDEVSADIAARNIYPPRTDVLDNPAIDRVTQSGDFDGPAPTTIRPRARPAAEAPPPAAPIELKVSPRVPGQAPRAALVPRSGETTPPATATTPAAAPPKAALAPVSSQFVVLQMKDPAGLASGLPFSADTTRGLVGLTISADSKAPARSFFRIGQRYAYRLAERDYEGTPVGIFSSREEIAEFFPGFNPTWYVLSPHEILNIGSGPWVTLGSEKKQTP
jgi:general secretion pathway protein D